jgi:NDP-sugar pyrophosphorylase family protein
MKVCILTAGIGSRMGEISDYLNKAILPTNQGSIISEIFNTFNSNTKFIIALGYKKKLVKDYIKLAHPNILKNITFIEVDNFDGKFSGPGYSLYKCKKKLNSPFFIISCDTLIKTSSKINYFPKSNIVYGKKVSQVISNTYCNFVIKQKKVTKIIEKKKYIKKLNCSSYSGFAFIRDYSIFWNDLKKSINVNVSPQVSDGFENLIKKKKLKFENINWIDVGKADLYNKYLNHTNGYDFSKKDEALYITNKKVIKYFNDKKILDNRYKKSKLLKNVFPNLKKKGNFYSYEYVDRPTLYNLKNQSEIFKFFLPWAKKNLWKKKTKSKNFIYDCKIFYYKKTFLRLKKILLKYDKIDEMKINGKKTLPIKEILSKINWNELYNGNPTFIHGDLHFDHIISLKKKNFLLLDWRDTFGKSMKVGDLNYDIAKILGGIILNYQLIKKNRFSYSEKKLDLKYKININKNLYKKNFEILNSFISNNGMNIKKIQTLVGIIYLNMSPLHNYPFDKLLFGLSKEILTKKNLFII